MFLVILLYALFASLFTLQKTTLGYTSPFFLVGSRMFFAGVVISLYLLFSGKSGEKAKFKFSHFKTFFMLGLSSIYLTNILEIWGLEKMISSKACLIYSLSPFVAAVVSYFVLGEIVEKRKWPGIFIGFLGLVPIIFMQSEEEILSGKILAFSAAEISLLGAVVTSSYGWILLKKLISSGDYTPLQANGHAMVVGGLMALAHSYLSGEAWSPIPVSMPHMRSFVVNSLVMCCISNLICYNLYGHLLKRFSATFMAFAGLVTPLFASFYGHLFLNERVTWHFGLSLFFFLIGLTLFYRQEVAS